MGIVDIFKPNVWKMGKKKDIDGLIKALEHKDAVVRERAARALGNIEDKLAIGPLIKALQDEEDEVRESAVKALGKIGDAKAAKPLTRLKKDESERVRAAAKWALTEIELEKESQKRREKKAEIRKMKAKKDIEGLINALKYKDFDVHWEAEKALRKIGSPAIEPLIQALKDEDNRVVEDAVEVLWGIGDPRGIEALKTIGPPITVKSRRESFSKKFRDITNHLSEMPIFDEAECNLALQSNPDIGVDGGTGVPVKLPSKAKELSNWEKANKEEIIDILSILTTNDHF